MGDKATQVGFRVWVQVADEWLGWCRYQVTQSGFLGLNIGVIAPASIGMWGNLVWAMVR